MPSFIEDTDTLYTGLARRDKAMPAYLWTCFMLDCLPFFKHLLCRCMLCSMFCSELWTVQEEWSHQMWNMWSWILCQLKRNCLRRSENFTALMSIFVYL